MNKIRAILGIAALSGAIVGLLSTLDHLSFRSGKAPTLCGTISSSGCLSAHSSKASEVFGLPISLWGVATYIGVLALVIFWPRLRGPGKRGAPRLIEVLGLGAVCYSVYLASLLILAGRMCAFCLMLYGVNGTLLLAGFLWSRRLPWQGGLVSFLAPGMVFGLGFGLSMAVGTPLYVHALNSAQTDKPLPNSIEVLDEIDLPDRVPRLGDPNAPLVVVEFSDFECPFCAAMHQNVEKLQDQFGEKQVQVRFINFPLDNKCNCYVSACLHPTACDAALAGICAARMGKFKEYAEKLFENRKDHSRERLLSLAGDLGLDRELFAECMDSPYANAALREDIEIAHKASVRATPTTIIGSRKFEGLLSLGQLHDIVGQLIDCGCRPDHKCGCLDEGLCSCEHDQQTDTTSSEGQQAPRGLCAGPVMDQSGLQLLLPRSAQGETQCGASQGSPGACGAAQ